MHIYYVFSTKSIPFFLLQKLFSNQIDILHFLKTFPDWGKKGLKKSLEEKRIVVANGWKNVELVLSQLGAIFLHLNKLKNYI